jgi:RES domain-containing protein
MFVYRLSKEIYAKDLSGKGAEIAGGRWNSKGTAMLYTSQNIALCVTEIAVHVPLGILPRDYCLIHIEIPDNCFTELKKLPKNWHSIPHNDATQQLGDQFIKTNKFLALKVPSATVQGEYNFLINPKHPDFNQVKVKKVEKFGFDERLFLK